MKNPPPHTGVLRGGGSAKMYRLGRNFLRTLMSGGGLTLDEKIENYFFQIFLTGATSDL